MITLTSKNYFSTEANRDYWSVSLFKEFDKCEQAGLATVSGAYKRPETDALLVGSYVDAYFSDELDDFMKVHGDTMFTKKGELYAKYNKANAMIDRIEQDEIMLNYLKGDKQVIMSGKLFGVDWKIKADVMTDKYVLDLKTVKDFEPIYKEGFGRLSWIEYWGYDIQGAIYQAIVEQNTGKRLPFYIAAVTKETVPDIDLIEISQPVLDTALKVVEAKIDRFDLVKKMELEPKRCEKCDWCKSTKVINVPKVYEAEAINA